MQVAKEESELVSGHVKWFDPVKGYGFVITADDQGDILIHLSALQVLGMGTIAEGSEVVASVAHTERGRQAIEILEVTEATPGLQIQDTFSDYNQVEFSDLDHLEPEGELGPARVKWFDKKRGFGFINLLGETEDVFVHMETLRRFGLADLELGEAILARTANGPRGRMAMEVRTWDYAAR